MLKSNGFFVAFVVPYAPFIYEINMSIKYYIYCAHRRFKHNCSDTQNRRRSKARNYIQRFRYLLTSYARSIYMSGLTMFHNHVNM